MAVQALTGLIWHEQYRDVDWIRLSWLGNDAVTLLAAVVLLICSRGFDSRCSVRRLITIGGILSYAVYNSAFYLLGAKLNIFFPLYVMLLLGSGAALGGVLTRTDTRRIAASFPSHMPARPVGVALVTIGSGLGIVWLGMWAAHVFDGRPLPVEVDAFRLVAALDLSLLVPMLIGSGLLLVRRRPWGFLLAPMASIFGAIYLLVLSVNSALMIRSGLADAPDELPIWGSLLVIIATLVGVLLVRAKSPEARPVGC